MRIWLFFIILVTRIILIIAADTKCFLNEYTNTAIDISIICESKALEVFYLKSLVSPATIVTVIGIRELLVRIVTSIGWEVPGMRKSSNVLLWLLVESSKAVLVVLAGTLKFKAVFEPVNVWVSIKQLSFGWWVYDCFYNTFYHLYKNN